MIRWDDEKKGGVVRREMKSYLFISSKWSVAKKKLLILG